MVLSMSSIKDKTILVTGSAGFIGSHLVNRLCEEQGAEINVIGLDNMNDYYDISLKEYRLKESLRYPTYTFVKCDIANREELSQVFETYHPHIVINLAAQAGVRYSITNPDVYITSNIVGFYNILEECRKYVNDPDHPLEHLIYASSSSVYGNQEKVPYSEDDKTDEPISLYAATKKSNELMAHSYSSLYQIPTTGLRFFTVYGPKGRPDMAYYSFTEKFIQYKKIQLYNHGNCERDFTYIDDVIDGIYSILQKRINYKNTPFRIYNIGGNNPLNLTMFVKQLHRALSHSRVLSMDHKLDEHIDYVSSQAGDVNSTYADTSCIAQDYNYKSRISIQEGLERFSKWYRNYHVEEYECELEYTK